MLFSSFSSPLLLVLSILGSEALPRQVEVTRDDAVEAAVADSLNQQFLTNRDDDDDDDSKIHEFKGNLTDIKQEEEDRIIGGFTPGLGMYPHMVSMETDRSV